MVSNQVSLNLVYGLESLNHWNSEVRVFVHGSRCSLMPHQHKLKNFKYINYSKVNLIKEALKAFVYRKRIYSYVPHLKLGNFVRNFLTFFSYRLNYIDDGLDTFRDIPNNINFTDLRPSTEYITFNYPFTTGKWTSKINFKPIINTDYLYLSPSKPIDLSKFDKLLVESPLVNEYFEESIVDKDNTFAIRHPNPKKKNLNFHYDYEASGKDFALENSLETFKGALFIGATMTFVCMSLSKDLPKEIYLILPSSEVDNYSPLCSMAGLIDTKVEIIIA